MYSTIFGSTSTGRTSIRNGYLEIIGCDRLPGAAALEGNLLINEPKGLGLETAQGGAAVGGTGFLKITGGSTTLSTYLHFVTDPAVGPLRLLSFEATASQPIWIEVSWPVPAEEVAFRGAPSSCATAANSAAA